MSKYLGEITIKYENNKYFVNYKPCYEYIGDKLSQLSKKKRQELLPESEYENIRFFSSNSAYVVKDNFHSNQYYVLDLEPKDRDLEANYDASGERSKTGYKLDIYKLEKTKLLFPHDIGYYRLIETEEIVEDYRANATLTLNAANVSEGMKVVLKIHAKDDILLGPFTIGLREKDGNFFVKTDTQSGEYVIPVIKFINGFNTDIEELGTDKNKQKYVKVNNKNSENDWIDIIPEDVLLESFRDTLNSDVFEDGRLNLVNIEGAIDASNFVGVDIPPEIKRKRRDDLRTILTDAKNLDETLGIIGDSFAALVQKYKDRETFAPIIQSLADDSKFMGQIFANDGVTIQAYLKKLEKDVDYQEERKRELDSMIKEVEGKLDGIFANSAEKAMNFAFDGMLSSRMLQTAAVWEAEKQQQDYAGLIASLKELPQNTLEKADLVDYLCEQIIKYRPSYGKNAILNMFICITQGFLTVFSGEPGTGKTSMCNIIANTLGLTLPKEMIQNRNDNLNPNRYISVSVERGWTSKRDFIGYYNPLTKQFDRSNRRLYDGLNLMDIEAKGETTNLPYLVLLDEANLSPMEYYWADFMNICDDLSDDSAINMGEDFHFQIPAFLRFVATMNNDHTTEALSPRLVDRAWVIKLPTVKSGAAKGTRISFDDVKAISWSSLVNTFDVHTEESAVQISGTAKDVYEAVLAKLKNANISVSSRADVAVRRYWSIAQSVFENELEYGVDAAIVALDYAISQRILPHINGSGDQFGEALKALAKLCGEKNLRMSADILSEIVRKGDEKMFYYQYFA